MVLFLPTTQVANDAFFVTMHAMLDLGSNAVIIGQIGSSYVFGGLDPGSRKEGHFSVFSLSGISSYLRILSWFFMDGKFK